jgi:hypothetical protein
LESSGYFDGNSLKIGGKVLEWVKKTCKLPYLWKIMHSPDDFFSKSLTFTADQLTIGEYQVKQELYFKQSPEILKGLVLPPFCRHSELEHYLKNHLSGICARI